MSIADKTTAHVVAVNTCMRALGDLEGLTYEQTRAALVRALYKPGDLSHEDMIGAAMTSERARAMRALCEAAQTVVDSPGGARPEVRALRDALDAVENL